MLLFRRYPIVRGLPQWHLSLGPHNQYGFVFRSRRIGQGRRSVSSNHPGGGSGDTPLHRKLMDTWRRTPTKWYPLPVAVGAILLTVLQWRRKLGDKEVHVDEQGQEVVRLQGPWQVHVLGALPLRSLSRLWGHLNSLELPVWFRPIGFRFYAWVFNCNLDEADHEDLAQYTSLGEFFYRKLRDGVRPIANAVLVSPADGTLLHFGAIRDGRIEQIKGSTYSLDALLGLERPDSPQPTTVAFAERDMAEVDDRSFAEINGIEYSLHEFLGTPHPPSASTSDATTSLAPDPQDAPGSESTPSLPKPIAEKHGEQIDASVAPAAPLTDIFAHEASVANEMGVQPFIDRIRGTPRTHIKSGHALFFLVIYLAPGDYHRFHSPTVWVVEKRRHFVGDLFSVSPWMVKRLQNLFVLNERVALMGRWKYGFFSMIPVGATNVGSIKINFDQALRTNIGARRPPPTGTYAEAVYTAASPILRGQPLSKAQEIGGFCLGSTVVLIFEAPENFKFTVTAGQRIKVGEALGDADSGLQS